MRCLVTKLEGVVNDLSLKRMGEIRIEINAKGGESFRINRGSSALGDLYVATLDGVARISETNGGTLVSEIAVQNVQGGVYKDVFLSAGEYTLKLIHKGNLGGISATDASFMSLNGAEWTNLPNINTISLNIGLGGLDVTNFAAMPKLSSLQLAGQNCVGDIRGIAALQKCDILVLNKVAIHGDISALADFTIRNEARFILCNGLTGDALYTLAKNTSLKTLSIEGSSSFSGNIESIKDMTNLQTLQINGTNVIGDLVNLGKLLQLSNFAPSNFLTGTVESLVAAFRTNGKREGTFTLKYAGGMTGATFEGISIKDWLKANGGKSSLKLTWTETTITGESV